MKRRFDQLAERSLWQKVAETSGVQAVDPAAAAVASGTDSEEDDVNVDDEDPQP